VAEIGRDGGDVADADVVLVAVPSGAIAEALANVSGLQGKIALDAKNTSRASARCSTRSRIR
jgi:predicted dinucleotide-binding enzyme